jgi:hypothetical protein
MKAVRDETLMAYADGMLPDDEMTEVERIIANDPIAAAKVEKFRLSTVLVKNLGTSIGKMEVSPELRRRVEAMGAQPEARKDNIVSFPVRAANSNQKQFRTWQAIAAAVALFSVGIWSGSQFAGQNNAQFVAVGTTLPGDILNVLAKLPSGEAQTAASGKVQLIASFNLADGSFCREFELTPGSGSISTLAIACKTADQAFTTRMALSKNSQTTGYSPASANETIDAFLTSIGAGSPMSAQEEQNALQK